MSFSKAVLLLVFSVLLISAEVIALRDLAETKTTPTTGQYDHGSYQRIEGPKPTEGLECSRNKNMACRKVPKCTDPYNRNCHGYGKVPNCTDPYNRNCHGYGNGGKGGNGEKGGRGAPGPETKD